MKIIKRIMISLAVLLVILQFIRPAKNTSASESQNDITKQFHAPQDVQNILRASCYDCHSNSTRYPWYAEIQPIGWWLDDHIQDAKQELNFSEFAGYKPRRQYRKLDEMIKQVSEGEMPLPPYLIIHTEANLSEEQKNQIMSWANAMRDTMKANYPADSLVRKQ